MAVLVWLVVGLAAGMMARMVEEGHESSRWMFHLGPGVLGAIVGGYIGAGIADEGSSIGAGGVFGALVGAVLVLTIAHALARRERQA
jgi:uncharacterized membrane protein YeaQ/YmgE (transglycosylase-associated protein family)